MDYFAPTNGDLEDPDRPYNNANPSAGIRGSRPHAKAIEGPMREILAVIDEAGIERNAEDFTQLLQAIMAIIEANTIAQYNNAASGLAAETYQAAIDEMVSGGVLKVNSTTKTDPFSSSGVNGVFNTITGFQVAMTPLKNSDKILISGCLFVATSQTTASALIKILRNGVEIFKGTSTGNRVGVTGSGSTPNTNDGACISFEFLDSPNSTDEQIYTVKIGQVATSSNVTVTVNRSYADLDTTAHPRMASSLTAKLIGA